MLENLTVVIPFRNGHAHLGRLLDSLPANLPVIVVDDLSDPPLQVDTDDVERQQVRILRLRERGYFAGAVNAGIAACTTDVLVLNQDVELRGREWQLLIEGQRRQYAILGDGVLNHPAYPRGYVQGTFMFLRRAAIERVGAFDEREYPLWGCTAEWQLRACRQGFEALPIALSDSVLKHAREGNYGSSISAALKEEPEKQGWFIRTPPAVSVIITCYNYGRYLKDAVGSLLGGETSLGVVPPQTFQSFEIVIVDDGSTDNSPALGRALADDWKGVRFLGLEKNVGSAAAANAGIAASYGKFVTVLDADDMMEPTRLEKLYRAAVANPHAVIYDDLYLFKDGRRTSVYQLSPYNFEVMLNKNGMHKGILYPRQAWREVGGYPERMREGREDWAMNVALGVKGYCGVHIKEPLYLYRREGHNRTLRNTGGDWHAFFAEEMHALFPHIYAGERPMGCCGQGSAKAKTSTSRSGGHALGAGGRFAMSKLPGESGMVLLEYVPDRAGTQQFVGAVTNLTYVFGGARRQGYVDTRDVPQLLELMEGHRELFRRVESSPPDDAGTSAGADPKGISFDGGETPSIEGNRFFFDGEPAYGSDMPKMEGNTIVLDREPVNAVPALGTPTDGDAGPETATPPTDEPAVEEVEPVVVENTKAAVGVSTARKKNARKKK